MSQKFATLNFKKTPIEQKNVGSSLLSLAFCKNEECNLKEKTLFNNISTDDTADQSFQPTKGLSYINNSIHKNIIEKDLRKDIYGNIIKKGGKHKVSFKDDLKGKPLVEMTFYSSKENCMKNKNYKKYTYNRVAKDKQEMTCCNIY